MKSTHLILEAGHETIEVFLGPSKFITRREFSFAQGDLINVTGRESRPMELTISSRGKS
jgi:hypothetical protein